MKHKFINNIEVSINGDPISDDELSTYLTHLQLQKKHKIVKAHVTVDGEYIDVNYTFRNVPFERIRRITGYLVGTTARWGDAKQAELRERVYHSAHN